MVQHWLVSVTNHQMKVTHRIADFTFCYSMPLHICCSIQRGHLYSQVCLTQHCNSATQCSVRFTSTVCKLLTVETF